jgi:hypothetical protein
MMRKAQGTPQSYIALLIFVIGVAMIVYILMLPPAEREILLGENRTRLPGVRDRITVLLLEVPGTLSTVPNDRIVQDFPDFTLFSRTDTRSVISFDSILVRKSLFEEQQREISFSIDDFDATENFVLSFNAPRRNGILTIRLNSQILTSAQYTTSSPPSIRLPRDWLQRVNTLVFSVSGPGIEFWKTNEYLIENMMITADFTDFTGRESKQVFIVTEKEWDNLESFQLTFIVECRPTEVSPLDIYLNKRRIYYAIPDCGSRITVPPQDATRVRQGENDLVFSADRGYFEIYSVQARLKLKEAVYPTYYFYITQETYDRVRTGQADINVTMLFTNAIDRKTGTILINGLPMDLMTYESMFSRRIDNFIRPGSNAVEIRPRVDKLNILELSVLLAE